MNIVEEKVVRYFAVTVSYIHYILVKYGGWSKKFWIFYRRIPDDQKYQIPDDQNSLDIFQTYSVHSKNSGHFFWANSRWSKILDIFLDKFRTIKHSENWFSSQILQYLDNFRTFSGCTRTFLDTISGHFFFIGYV